jgi:hypothetical protein
MARQNSDNTGLHNISNVFDIFLSLAPAAGPEALLRQFFGGRKERLGILLSGRLQTCYADVPQSCLGPSCPRWDALGTIGSVLRIFCALPALFLELLFHCPYDRVASVLVV